MAQGILLSAENEIDFMIHGVFSYNFFGTEVWIYLKRCLEAQDYIIGEITKDYELVGLEIKWMVFNNGC